MLYLTSDGTISLTLEDGSYGEETLCLDPGFYNPIVCDGLKPEEVSWEIVGYNRSGGADQDCWPYVGTFYVGSPCEQITIIFRDSYGDRFHYILYVCVCFLCLLSSLLYLIMY